MSYDSLYEEYHYYYQTFLRHSTGTTQTSKYQINSLLSPNPATGDATASFNDERQRIISVMDVTGREISVINTSERQTYLNLGRITDVLSGVAETKKLVLN